MYNFIDIAFNPICRMSEVKRYSGVHQECDEVLSEHITDVSMLSYLISMNLRKRGEDIDVGILLEKCLMHDIDETLTGDIPRNTKYATKKLKKEADTVARLAVKTLSSQLQLDHIYELWETSKSGKEGFILKISDMLSVVKKAIVEVVLRNNYTFLKVVDEVHSHLKHLLMEMDMEHNDFSSPEAYQWLLDLVADALKEIDVIYNKYQDKITKYHMIEK